MRTTDPLPPPRLRPRPRRVRPADLLPPVPPLPSHTAAWHDLVVLDDSHLSPEHAPPLVPGWSSDWTVTTRRGAQEDTVAAEDLSWDTVGGADPMLVAHWHPKATARAGLKFISDTGRHHSFQSMFERNLLFALEFHGLHDLTSQPFELEWHDGTTWRRHTPDFAVLLPDGPALFNVRPAARLNDAHRENTAALAALARIVGWRCHTVVDYATPALPILRACAAVRHAPDRLGICDQVAAALATGPTTIGDAATQTVCEPFARSALMRMVWHRQVSIDLNRRLHDGTIVTAA